MRKVLLIILTLCLFVGCSKDANDITNREDSLPFALVSSEPSGEIQLNGDFYKTYKVGVPLIIEYGVQMGNNKQGHYELSLITSDESIVLDEGTIKKSFWVNRDSEHGLIIHHTFNKEVAFSLKMTIKYDDGTKVFEGESAFTRK